MALNLRNLTVSVSERPGDVTLAKIEGEVDTISSEDIKTMIEHFQCTGRKKLIFDLEEVTYLNSKAIGVLSQALRRMRHGGGDLKLCNLSPVVRKIFEITSLFEVFAVYESVEEAVEAYAREG